jgi:hypothetical protein
VSVAVYASLASITHSSALHMQLADLIEKMFGTGFLTQVLKIVFPFLNFSK